MPNKIKDASKVLLKLSFSFLHREMTIVKKLQKKIVNVCTLTQKEEWARHKRNGERGKVGKIEKKYKFL